MCALVVLSANIARCRSPRTRRTRCVYFGETRCLLRVAALGRRRDTLTAAARRGGDRNRWTADGIGSGRWRLGIPGLRQHALPLALAEAGRVLIADLNRRRVETAGEPLEPVGTVALTDVDHGVRHPAFVDQTLRGVADHPAGKGVKGHR